MEPALLVVIHVLTRPWLETARVFHKFRIAFQGGSELKPQAAVVGLAPLHCILCYQLQIEQAG